MAGKRQLVVFTLGGTEFALDIALTKEVATMREITPLPETDTCVEGIVNLRGNLVPVLDLRKRLRAPDTTGLADRRMVIVSFDGKSAALIVDDASEVIRVSDDLVEPVPDLISEIGADYVEGVINLKDRFITLIDLRLALSGEIGTSLEEVMQALISKQKLAPAQARLG
ncbi:MAG TPA: chemotaxis protein CheW [Blastocatellia bacterium]|nr:chemotaxis protein CheW [Blastocatellia bacterium]